MIRLPLLILISLCFSGIVAAEGNTPQEPSPSACSKCDSRDCYKQCFEVQKKYNTQVYKLCFEKQKALTADAEAKCSFTVLTSANIKDAWLQWGSGDKVKAEETYGRIEDWDVSRVTDMTLSLIHI